jgi:hypothetical protein
VGRHVVRIAALALGLVFALTACASEARPPAAKVVTFEVTGGSRYKVLVTDAKTLDVVTRLSKGEDAPSIPNGKIVHETGVNTGWSWSIDPADFRFDDITDSTCQGTPEEIEAGTFTGDRFCPWSAIVVALDPAP